ncbi:hypothetical protein L6R50_12590 [Myxococcota bacterium]|nr:hypothetical protein [Myxococcota bacterium]
MEPDERAGDLTPEACPSAACRWVRETAANSTVGERSRLFRARVFAPLLLGPVGRRASSSGLAVDVHPLAPPDGEGMSLPLGHLGELGYRNFRDTLVISVPLPMAGWAARQFGDAVVGGPARRKAASGGAAEADLWLRLRPGARKSLPLGTLGELGVEAAE